MRKDRGRNRPLAIQANHPHTVPRRMQYRAHTAAVPLTPGWHPRLAGHLIVAKRDHKTAPAIDERLAPYVRAIEASLREDAIADLERQRGKPGLSDAQRAHLSARIRVHRAAICRVARAVEISPRDIYKRGRGGTTARLLVSNLGPEGIDAQCTLYYETSRPWSTAQPGIGHAGDPELALSLITIDHLQTGEYELRLEPSDAPAVRHTFRVHHLPGGWSVRADSIELLELPHGWQRSQPARVTLGEARANATHVIVGYADGTREQLPIVRGTITSTKRSAVAVTRLQLVLGGVTDPPASVRDQLISSKQWHADSHIDNQKYQCEGER